MERNRIEWKCTQIEEIIKHKLEPAIDRRSISPTHKHKERLKRAFTPHSQSQCNFWPSSTGGQVLIHLPNIHGCGDQQLDAIKAATSGGIVEGQCSSVGSFAAGNAPRMVHLAHLGHVAQIHHTAHTAQVGIQLVGVHSARINVAAVVLIAVQQLIVHIVTPLKNENDI